MEKEWVKNEYWMHLFYAPIVAVHCTLYTSIFMSYVLCLSIDSMQYSLCADKYQNATKDLQRVRVQVRDQIINYLAMFLCMDSL